MNTFPTYTEAKIRAIAGAEVFERGRNYCDSGMVHELVMRGNTLYAEVEGSQYEPYQVTVEFAQNEILSANCTCPYDYGGWCKHIVAALLAALEEPKMVEERVPVQELLAGLDRAELHELLLELIDETPTLISAIESWIAQRQLLAAATPTPAATKTTTAPQPNATAPQAAPLEEKATRQQVRQALRGVSRVDATERLLNQVRALLTSGENRNALTLLQAVTAEFVATLPNIYEYDDYGDYDADDGSQDLLQDLSNLWAEVILSVDLTATEREKLTDTIEDWDESASQDGYDVSFGAAELALQYGWDYPPLQRAMQGEITERGAWEGEAPWGADELAQVRLQILERQGRSQEYLNLAQAEGQLREYVLMLAKLGRVEEAVSEGTQYLAQVDELFALAQQLERQKATGAAAQVAEHALAHGQGDKGDLAQWLRNFYVAQGDATRAIPMAITALAERPSLAAYHELKEMAGENWSKVQAQALSALRNHRSYFGDTARTEIFLSEELWDDAITSVDGTYGSAAMTTVMQRVYQHRPDWVIRRAGKFADDIMEAGKADNYTNAVAWLNYAKRAYLTTGRKQEWEQYLQAIRSRHARKHKLINLLKPL